jgi:hypothetical protein
METSTRALIGAGLGILVATGCDRTTSDTLRPDAASGHTSHGAAAALSPADARAVQILKKEMARYHSFGQAGKDGYSTAITACMENPPIGAMGVHYGNTSIIDGAVTQFRPEVLMYEPGPQGQQKFVGVEFIVPFTAWTSPTPPVLFGQTFMPNQTFQVWALHVWVGRENPLGLFADWNPRVSC